MKVLTVKNPWAFLIIHYGKDIENRSRKTNYRGRIAIHASKQSDKGAYLWTAQNPVLKKAFQEIRERRDEIEKLNGHIIGSVEIYNCAPPGFAREYHHSLWGEMDAEWHYWLKEPVAFPEPIAARGMLGLWEYYERSGDVV
jgi:hypothetical protein